MASSPKDYTVVLPILHFARFLEAVAAAEERVRLDSSRSVADRQRGAQAIRRAYNEYERDLRQVAVTIATYAERDIKEREKTTRVRPDTRGEGGPRLGRGIGKSRPIKEIPGSVGINDTEWAVAKGVEWWWTNEWGYSGHIGRVVHGFFYDVGFTGRARPDPSRMREHPLFRPEGPQRRAGYRQVDATGAAFHKRTRKQAKLGRPGMLISQPIPARRFVRDGALAAERRWHQEVERARQRFLRRIAGL